MVIDTHDISKTYNPETIPVHAISQVHLHIEQGEFTALVGPSGSGKTTLLNIIGGLDRPTSGKVIINGTDISGLSPGKLIKFRLHNIGFVFQSFNLIPTLTAEENIRLPELIASKYMDGYAFTSAACRPAFVITPKTPPSSKYSAVALSGFGP